MGDEIDAIIDQALEEEAIEQAAEAASSIPAVAAAVAKSVVRSTRKRKAKDLEEEATKAEVFRWNQHSIETLLQSRSDHRQFFLDVKNKAKLNQGWSKIVLDIKIGCGVEPTMTQVKNKYQAIQALYRKTCQEIQKQETRKELPSPYFGMPWSVISVGDKECLMTA